MEIAGATDDLEPIEDPGRLRLVGANDKRDTTAGPEPGQVPHQFRILLAGVEHHPVTDRAVVPLANVHTNHHLALPAGLPLFLTGLASLY